MTEATPAVEQSRSPQPGTPYHLLSRNAAYHWYRSAIELLVFGILWLALGALCMGVIGSIAPEGESEDGAWGLVGIGLGLAAFAPASLIAARAMGRLAGTMSSVIGRVRWRWLATCTLVFFVAYLVTLGAFVVIELVAPTGDLLEEGDAWPGATTFLPQLALILAIVPLQAAGEEYAFRGTLLQSFGAWFGSPWIGLAITSVAFAAMHAPTEWILWVALIWSGVVTAWLTVKTGGLEAAIAQHAINNVVGFSLDAATGGLGSWAEQLNTDVPVFHTLFTIATMTAAAVVVERMARRKGIATVVPAPPPA